MKEFVDRESTAGLALKARFAWKQAHLATLGGQIEQQWV